MKTYKFKTNINCSGCVAAVTPKLNSDPQILEWKVDTSVPEKILTVDTETLSPGEVARIVEKAGYKAETL